MLGTSVSDRNDVTKPKLPPSIFSFSDLCFGIKMSGSSALQVIKYVRHPKQDEPLCGSLVQYIGKTNSKNISSRLKNLFLVGFFPSPVSAVLSPGL